MGLINIYEKLASHDKKPSVETLPHKKGPIKHEGKKHPKEHGVVEDEGKTIPREVKSLADRIREKEGVSDEYAYRAAWKIYEKHTAEGKHYKPLHGKHHGEKPLAEPSKGGHPIEKKGFVLGFGKVAMTDEQTAGALHALTPLAGAAYSTAKAKKHKSAAFFKSLGGGLAGGIAGNIAGAHLGRAAGHLAAAATKMHGEKAQIVKGVAAMVGGLGGLGTGAYYGGKAGHRWATKEK